MPPYPMPDRSHAIASAYLAGVSLREISRQFSLPHGAIYHHLHILGVKPNRTRIRAPKSRDEVTLREADVLVRHVAEALDLTPDAARRRLLLDGDYPEPSRRRDEEVERIAALRRDGWTLEQLAAEMGLSYGSIRNRLARAGLLGAPEHDGRRLRRGQPRIPRARLGATFFEPPPLSIDAPDRAGGPNGQETRGR